VNAKVVAADLIGQAEHDVVAMGAILLSTSPDIICDLDIEVQAQLDSLPEPNKCTAREALTQSFAVQC
jgi:histidinol dehydrogenase